MTRLAPCYVKVKQSWHCYQMTAFDIHISRKLNRFAILRSYHITSHHIINNLRLQDVPVHQNYIVVIFGGIFKKTD